MIGETVCFVAGIGLFLWVLQLAEKYLNITILNGLFERSRLRASLEGKPHPNPKLFVIWTLLLCVGLLLLNYRI
jgi:hypothetical protein